MLTRRTWTGVGTTRLDLLVLLGMGAMVGAIAIPLVLGPRAQARITQCVSNLGLTMRATHMYLGDYDDRPPPLQYENGVATWSYGGMTASPYWQYASGGVFYLPVERRPLNPYLLGGPIEPDVRMGDLSVARTPIPALYCPSDFQSYQRPFSSDPGAMSTYEDVGTSYMYNLNMVSSTAWGASHDTNLWAAPGTWDELQRLAVRRHREGEASDLVWYYDDAWSFASWFMTPSLLGEHGEISRFSAGYLDGHADYGYREVLNYCGPGWALIVKSWIASPGDIPMPAHYWPLSMQINCFQRQ